MNATQFFDWGVDKKYKERLREKVTNLFRTASFNFNTTSTSYYGTDSYSLVVKKQSSAENEIFYTIDYIVKEKEGRVFKITPYFNFTFTDSIEFFKNLNIDIVLDGHNMYIQRKPQRYIRENSLSLDFLEYRVNNNHIEIKVIYND